MKSAFQLPHIPLTRPIILLRELRFYSSRQAETEPKSSLPYSGVVVESVGDHGDEDDVAEVARYGDQVEEEVAHRQEVHRRHAAGPGMIPGRGGKFELLSRSTRGQPAPMHLSLP